MRSVSAHELSHGRLELRACHGELGLQAFGLRLSIGHRALGVFEALGPFGDLTLGGVEPLLGGVLGARDALGQLGLEQAHLLTVLALHAGQLGLELFARRAHLLLQLGLALEQVGPVRGGDALELGLRGAELVLEHRGTLLFGAQRTELGTEVVDLAVLRRELGLRGLGRLPRAEALDVDRVQIVLQLAGARRVGLGDLQLPLGERQFGLGTLELGTEADQLLLGLTDPGGVVTGSLSLGLRRAVDDAPRQLLVLGLQRLRLPFEQTGPLLQLASAVLGRTRPFVGFPRMLLELASARLGLHRPLLHAGVGARRDLLGLPMNDLQLLQGVAVLLLEDGQPLLRRAGAIFGDPAGVGLFLDPRLGHRHRPWTGRGRGRRLARDARLAALFRANHHRVLGLGRLGRRVAERPQQQGDHHDQRDGDEDGVRAPGRRRGDDLGVGARELDGGGLSRRRS